MDTDVLIVGGGASGLSLAVHALERAPQRRVTILEPRTEYTRDRTWCSWRVRAHPFERCVSHRWPRWRVASSGREVIRTWSGHPYEHIPADAFYREAQERIAASPRIELRLGVTVDALEDRGDRVVAETSAGRIEAKLAFDSRPVARASEGTPPQSGDANVTLVQSFVGWIIELDRPLLSPDVATLMDFGPANREGVHFVYVLPYDDRRALVEDTWFSARPLADRVYEKHLDAYIDMRFGGVGYRIVDRERGTIPMTTETPDQRPSRRVYRIGVAGGLAKPSTGYAFLAIQRWSEAMSARLAREELPDPPPPRSARAMMLDRVFLSFLRRSPERAPETFLSLFQRTPADALVRFLSEESTAADDLRVIAAAPRLPLMAEAARSTSLWMRRARRP